ncbi:MAG: hypothetical protein CMN74_12545 [Sphingorhabdus sp.]|nr:hypothetical protein [Sphingorhabdus sp.]
MLCAKGLQWKVRALSCIREGHMAKVPITVYLTDRQLAAIERQAEATGKSRSAWVSQALIRAVEGELSPLDDVLLDQLTKVRANQEHVLKSVASLSKSINAADVQKASLDLADRMFAEAKSRVGK